MALFRLGKRNFSLRDSPNNKLSSLSPRPRLTSDSPAKRLKFGDANQLLSSTLLSETKIVDEGRAESINGETNHLFDRSSSFINEKSTIEQEVSTSKVAVDSPSPAPSLKVTSKLEILTKQQLSLTEESDKLDAQIEAKQKALDECQREINLLRASRFKYEDISAMITRGQNEIRDHLNQIFGPGNEMAQKFEPLFQELASRHSSKRERFTLEWNCLIDQVKSVIAKREEDLKHEMELHQRTLIHQQHLSKVQEEAAASANEQEKKTPGPDNSAAAANTREENHDLEECIIIDNSDDAIRVDHEETVAEQSAEIVEFKQEQDDDDTDVEETNGEDGRSFTPCQAQRAE